MTTAAHAPDTKRAVRPRRALAIAVASLAAALPAALPHPAEATHDPLSPSAPLQTVFSAPLCPDDDYAKGTRSAHGGDMAFWGDRAVLACGADDEDLTNDGFVILDVKDPRNPRKLGEFRCVASASDIAIWRDLVFLAVDRNAESEPAPSPGPVGEDCAAELNNAPQIGGEPRYFQGVRIVSIEDPAHPVVIKSIWANSSPEVRGPGAHNVTVVPALKHEEDGVRTPSVLVYALTPGFNTQDMIAVPIEAPHLAKKIASTLETPGLTDERNNYLPGSNGCHDLSVFLPRGIAACHVLPAINGFSGTILYDIRDDRDDGRDDGASLTTPVRRGQILASLEAQATGRRDHSGAFSWDGNTLVITDENLSNVAHGDCGDGGKLWFYDVSDPDSPRFVGSQGRSAATDVWCYPKQVSVIPLRSGRDVLIASWLGGGTTVVDFTDPARPAEIAHVTKPFPDAASDTGAGDRVTHWASHHYAGVIFANNAYGCARPGFCFGSEHRGLDVLESPPSLAGTDVIRLTRFNQGLQECLPTLAPRLDCS